MCGLLFVKQGVERPVSLSAFEAALQLQSWRGPDATHVTRLDDGLTLLGHNRLSILDPAPRADQPMRSPCGRYLLIFNGEIYNHADLRKHLDWRFRTGSDTETLLAGLTLEGRNFITRLDGMFAFVLHDTARGEWLAARDPFGIKPLHIHQAAHLTIIASEAASIATLCHAHPDPESLAEWALIRRPAPGHSYFKGIQEISPGTCLDGSGKLYVPWQRSAATDTFRQDEFESLVEASVRQHQLSDVPVTGLLSGGLDSAVIAASSTVSEFHSAGLHDNNEFDAAEETASRLERSVTRHAISAGELTHTWRYLTKLRGEPLSVPNEGLIYTACAAMPPSAKVVLTGEGADELLFGYDNIFRWANAASWNGPEDFLRRYGYSDTARPSHRLLDYIESLHDGKRLIDFTEDFFHDIHLPGLLRRMDFAAMAASREARVPFVCKRLVNYMYRRPSAVRLDAQNSKLPLRRLATRQGLAGALERKKIGFSASTTPKQSRLAEYANFRHCILETLKW